MVRTALVNRPYQAAFKGKIRGRNASGGTAPGDKRAEIARLIRALPSGRVSSYGGVAKAAGWPGAARQVVRILRQVQGLPWHRVLGAGGAIKLPGESGAEQRFRLRMEGVTFRGARVDMKLHEFHFPGNTRSQPREEKRAEAKRVKRKRARDKR
jgi:methylated-DNA-protein-cysteine methyltransferase-like protein